MKNRILLLSVLFILFSCSNEKSNVEHHKPYSELSTQVKNINIVDKVRLKGETVLKRDSGAIEIHLYDSILILRQLGDGDVFHVYNTDGQVPLGSIGKKGIGPKDFIGPRISDQFFIQDDDLHVLVFDARKSELRDLNISSSLNNKKTEFQLVKKMRPSLGLTQFLLLASDSTYVGNHGPEVYSRSKLLKVDSMGNIINNIPLFPVLDGISSINPFEKYQLFFDYLRKKPGEDLFVSVLTRFDQLDIFDQGFQNSISIRGPQAENKYNLSKLKEGQLDRFYYRDVRVDENYIYALFHDQLIAEASEVEQDCEIRVFNWQGDLIKIFKVDYILNFAVDPKNQTIYGLDFLNERILKYKYQL